MHSLPIYNVEFTLETQIPTVVHIVQYISIGFLHDGRSILISMKTSSLY